MGGYPWNRSLWFITAIFGGIIGGMAQSDVMLHVTSNLTEGDIAYDGQSLTFRCIIRGSGTILTWSSDELVGTGGYTLQFASVQSPGRTSTSVNVPTTNATLISTNTVNGVTVIESVLHIRATLQHPTSTVTCRVNGQGTSNTTTFRVVSSVVKLTNNMTLGNIAYDGQSVPFRCIMRGSGTILTWSSGEHIGTGGYTLQFASVQSPGRTSTSVNVPTTNATLISTNTINGVTVVESILYVIATLQHPTSSVSCRVNGQGYSNTMLFQTLPRPAIIPTTSMMVETGSVSDDDSSSTATDMESTVTQDTTERLKKNYMKIGFGAAGAVVLFIVIIVIIIAVVIICKLTRTHKVHDSKKTEELPDVKSETSSGSSVSVPSLEEKKEKIKL